MDYCDLKMDPYDETAEKCDDRVKHLRLEDWNVVKRQWNIVRGK